MHRIARALMGSSCGLAIVALTLAVSPSAAYADACPDPNQADDIRCYYSSNGQS